MQSLRDALDRRDDEIANAKTYIASLEQRQAEPEAKRLALQAALKQAQEALTAQRQQADEAVNYATSLERAYSDKEAELNHLRQAYAEHSLLMRGLVRPIWKVRRALLPDGSKRAQVYFGLRRRIGSLVAARGADLAR